MHSTLLLAALLVANTDPLALQEVEEHDAFGADGLRETGHLPVHLEVVPLA